MFGLHQAHVVLTIHLSTEQWPPGRGHHHPRCLFLTQMPPSRRTTLRNPNLQWQRRILKSPSKGWWSRRSQKSQRRHRTEAKGVANLSLQLQLKIRRTKEMMKNGQQRNRNSGNLANIMWTAIYRVLSSRRRCPSNLAQILLLRRRTSLPIRGLLHRLRPPRSHRPVQQSLGRRREIPYCIGPLWRPRRWSHVPSCPF